RRLIGSSAVTFSAVGVSPCSTGRLNCWLLVRLQNSKVGADPRSVIDSVVAAVVESVGAVGSAGAPHDAGALITKKPTTPASAIARPKDFRNITATVCIVEIASTPITETPLWRPRKAIAHHLFEIPPAPITRTGSPSSDGSHRTLIGFRRPAGVVAVNVGRRGMAHH